jgi:hypothetical protein
LNQTFCDPNFFQATPQTEIAQLEAEHSGLTTKVQNLMHEWENLEHQIGELADH